MIKLEGIDEFTFGNGKAAINLTHILNAPEYSRYSLRALRMLSKYMTSIKALTFVPHKETRETALGIWRDNFVRLVDGTDFPEVIKTHMNNVATGQKRKWLRGSKDETG